VDLLRPAQPDFDSWLVPFLGFLLLPWDDPRLRGDVGQLARGRGFEWFPVNLAFLIDLASYAGRGRFARD